MVRKPVVVVRNLVAVVVDRKPVAAVVVRKLVAVVVDRNPVVVVERRLVRLACLPKLSRRSHRMLVVVVVEGLGRQRSLVNTLVIEQFTRSRFVLYRK